MNDTEKRQELIRDLEQYTPWDAVEEGHREIILGEVMASSRWWHRSHLPGHVTASGFIVSPDGSQMLLHHHRKLGKWLQLGGHDEGEQSPREAVQREIREESGLQDFAFAAGGQLFDLDVHGIPETEKMAAHLHLDCRFLVYADPNAPLILEENESLDLRWFPLEEAIQKMNEVGAQRVFEKIRAMG